MNVHRQVGEFMMKLESRNGSPALGELLEYERRSRERFGGCSLPESHEIVAVSQTRRKTSALCFDRVWATPSDPDPPPSSIRVYGETELEVWGQLAALGFQSGWWDRMGMFVLFTNTPLAKYSPDRFHVERIVSQSLASTHGIAAVPVFPSMAEQMEQYQPGSTKVVLAVLDSLAVVDEASLSWEQVVEFRNDAVAKAKYRKLLHWLDSEMIGKSVAFVVDEVAIRVNDSELALRKHGIKTALGSLARVLDPAFLAAAAGTVTVAAITDDATWAVLAGTAVGVGRAAISVATDLLDLADQRRTLEGEVAFVHHVKRQLV